MPEKKCGRCQITKDVSMFYKEKSKKDGYQYSCKECEEKRKRSEDYKPTIYKHKRICKERKINLYTELKNNLKCCLCNEDNNICLDFHHIEKKHDHMKTLKLNMKTFIIRYGYQQIKDELNKCICVCSNCHRKIHANIIILTEEQKKEFRINISENELDNILNKYKDKKIKE